MNTREYEYADIQLLLNGNDITGIRSLRYDETIERETLYAKGRHAHSIQSGNISVSGELAVTQSELESLITAGGGSILNLKNLTAVISYDDGLGTLVTDRIEGIAFTKSEKEMKQGDKFMEVKLPFIALRVLHHV